MQDDEDRTGNDDGVLLIALRPRLGIIAKAYHQIPLSSVLVMESTCQVRYSQCRYATAKNGEGTPKLRESDPGAGGLRLFPCLGGPPFSTWSLVLGGLGLGHRAFFSFLPFPPSYSRRRVRYLRYGYSCLVPHTSVLAPRVYL